MEIELRDEAQEVVFPKGIRVIREVTGDARYGNFAMAREMPVEG